MYVILISRNLALHSLSAVFCKKVHHHKNDSLFAKSRRDGRHDNTKMAKNNKSDAISPAGRPVQSIISWVEKG